ncbi:MAG: plastocyanin/azurin family copper-binding protein [Paracoccus sp. (in: a-proteobacteria)]|nr:plastocyanin/azurin family copper-binding protein [Paracoccus sp. (in: a-proteobacteria)]
MDRRTVLTGCAAFALALAAALRGVGAAQAALIEMRGSPRGERVWFAPIGLAVAPGATVRFVNRDDGNSHTATTYHPDILDRPLRIPPAAEPWDSGLLLPGEEYSVTLTAPGVYDIYCQPHEMAGMIARIVLGTPQDGGWQGPVTGKGDLPGPALAMFPSVERILDAGAVMPETGGQP